MPGYQSGDQTPFIKIPSPSMHHDAGVIGRSWKVATIGRSSSAPEPPSEILLQFWTGSRAWGGETVQITGTKPDCESGASQGHVSAVPGTIEVVVLLERSARKFTMIAKFRSPLLQVFAVMSSTALLTKSGRRTMLMAASPCGR